MTMTETLEFPPIEAPAAPLAPASIKSAVLAQFADAERTVTALADKYRRVAYDCTTTAGMAAAKAARMDLRENGRYAVQRAESRVKTEVNDLKRVMADEVARIVEIVRPVEDAIDQQIKAREEQVAAEKAERERQAAEAARLEAERRQRLEDGITTLEGYVTKAKGWTAAKMAEGIAFVDRIVIEPAHWQEYTERAAVTLAKTRETLRAMHAAQVKAEADAAELEALRAEKAARERREREEAEAAARAESERMAEAKRQADETAVLAASIRAESRRVEWPKNPAYIRKAMGTFECMAPDWENDPRDAVREAIAEGRSYLAALMSDALAAEREAREHSELEAERIAGLEAGAPKPQDAELALAEALILQDTMTLPEGGGTIIVVAPDSGKDWEQALRGNGEPAPADVPLIRGEIGSIVGRVNITTVPDSEMTAGWSLPKTEPAPPPVEAPAADPAALEPTITIGDINTRLGFLVTADLVIGLGFVRQVRIGRGVHFLASEWPRLCDALTAHIKAKREAY